MKIAAFSVKNHSFTLILFVMVMLLGANSLLNMPRSEDPDLESPFFAVVAIYPGVSPQDMEKLVADPVEESLSELEEVKQIISDIGDGVSVTRIDFRYDTDVQDKYQEVVREINRLADELPDDLYSLEVRRFRPSDVNILQAALLSETASYRAMEEQAQQLERALEKIPALKNVRIAGMPAQEVEVSLQLDKMTRLGIPLARVLQAIQLENINLPGGSLSVGQRKFNVKTSGSYEALEEIRNTVVSSSGQKIVYLKDIAQVDMGYAEETHLVRLNGQRGIWISAALKEGENISKIQASFQPVLDQFSASLPADMQLVKHFDQTESVGRRLKGLGRDFMIAILLVSVTLLPLGFRAALVVMVSIPLSLAMGLTLLDLMGYNINQLSIVGLVIALGILVDDSIVVVENIERWMREGLARQEAAIEATKQIGLAVLGCTATLVLAFLPLIFLPEASGDFIRSLPLAVITTVLASLLVSITIIPFLSSRLLSKPHSAEGNLFLRLLKKLISLTYSRLLAWGLDNPKTTLTVAALLFIGAVSLVPAVGFSLFPRSEKPQFLINITAAPGSNLQETNRISQWVENQLTGFDKVVWCAANVGHGNPRIYYNVIPADNDPEFAQLFVQLKTNTTPEEKTNLIDSLRQRFGRYPNARIEVRDFEQGPPIESPIAIRIFGNQLDSLRRLSFAVEEIVRKTPGTLYVNNPLQSLKTNLRVNINKDKAAMLGVPTAEIDRSIRLAVAGLEISQYNDPDGDKFPIVLRIDRDEQAVMKVFDGLTVSNIAGKPVPLRQLASLELETAPPVIRHFNQERYVTITAAVQTGYLAQDINLSLVDQLSQFPFPPGYRFIAAGELEAQSESFGGMGTIIIITTFLLIAVLVLEFRTFKSTLIVLSVIPLGIIGAILALLLTGNTFSFVAVVGLIALVGIEVKNSILLVDFTNQLRAEGYALDDAIREAGEIRFVPILLTAATAIGGLLPIAWEGNPLYSPLALVLIGGIISSTLLSRVVTPVVYKLIPPRIV